MQYFLKQWSLKGLPCVNYFSLSFKKQKSQSVILNAYIYKTEVNTLIDHDQFITIWPPKGLFLMYFHVHPETKKVT